MGAAEPRPPEVPLLDPAAPSRLPPLVLGGRPDGGTAVGLGHRVGVYVCGITPYDAAHVGHAFTYVHFDLLVRLLRHRGHEVVYCQNVTDVDDDILRRARERHEDYLELGRRETARYLAAMDALGVGRPSYFPRATEEVEPMVGLAARLVADGYAYPVDGWVFFDVHRMPAFGALSGLAEPDLVKLLADRGGNPADPRKRHPLDFVVWQASEPDEPAWASPWGPGRPGWHLECSAMAARYVGVTVDLHGGGADLLYPHHESERAQSEAANRTTFVRRWLHTGTVGYQGEKMSKALGNLVFVHDLLRRRRAGAIRLAVLDHQYATDWEFAEPELDAAEARLDAWATAAGDPGARGADGSPAGPVAEPVEQALAADLDAPAALAAVDELASAGDGPAVRAAAALLGVRLSPAPTGSSDA